MFTTVYQLHIGMSLTNAIMVAQWRYYTNSDQETSISSYIP